MEKFFKGEGDSEMGASPPQLETLGGEDQVTPSDLKHNLPLPRTRRTNSGVSWHPPCQKLLDLAEIFG